MFKTLLTLCCAAGLLASASMPTSVYDFSLKSIDGKETSLLQFKGKPFLLVNVASRCGFTPQYEGLEKLYERYKSQGFVIVGIPANNFGGQEPGSNQEIKSFCTRTYHVSFPMMAKVSVLGTDKAPLYQFLTSTSQNPETGGDIKWNFTKFLVGRDGKLLARFEPNVKPEDSAVVAAVESALK